MDFVQASQAETTLVTERDPVHFSNLPGEFEALQPSPAFKSCFLVIRPSLLRKRFVFFRNHISQVICSSSSWLIAAKELRTEKKEHEE